MMAKANVIFYGNSHDTKTWKSGWLRKQGGLVKSWNKRWCVLKGNFLYYYSSEDETKSELDKINIVDCKILELPLSSGDSDKYLIEIIREKTKSSESHILAASTEDDRHLWILALKRVALTERGGGIFGRELDEVMEYELSKWKSNSTPPKVPNIVLQCTSYLLENGLDVEGIFRLPGRTSAVKELRDAFDEGEQRTLPLETSDVHIVASLLKLYIRELPSPLVPVSSYQAVMKLAQLDMKLHPDTALVNLSNILTKIPRHSYNLLRHLCIFLKKVAEHSDKNKMTAMNLASIFMQNFLRPEIDDPSLLMGTTPGRTDATFLMIDKCREIFQTEYTQDGSLVEVKNLLGIDQNRLTLALGLNDDTEVLLEDERNFNDIPESLPIPLIPHQSNVNEIPYNDTGSHYEENGFSNAETNDENLKWEPLHFVNKEFSMANDQTSEHSPNANVLRRKPQPVARRNPVQRSSSLFSSSSVESSSNPIPRETLDMVNDEKINTLLDVDFSNFSYEDLLAHTKQVCSHLRQMQQRVHYLKAQHEAKLSKMAVKLNEEKEATSVTVKRVMDLQDQLHKYHLTFGALNK